MQVKIKGWYHAAEEDEGKFLPSLAIRVGEYRNSDERACSQAISLAHIHISLEPFQSVTSSGQIQRPFRNHPIRLPLVGGEGARAADPNPSSYPGSEQIFYVFSR